MTLHLLDHLLADHREIETVIAALESLLASHRAEGHWTAEHAIALLWITERLVGSVSLHLRKKEEILFPALEEFWPREEGPLAVLRSEQAQLHTHFRDLRAAGEKLTVGDGPPELTEEFQRAGLAILQGWRDHIYKQENVLFPLVGRLVSPDSDTAMLRRMEALASPLRG